MRRTSEASRLDRLALTVVMQESTHFDGQVLVAREAEGQQTGGASHVVDTYEPVAGIDQSMACHGTHKVHDIGLLENTPDLHARSFKTAGRYHI